MTRRKATGRSSWRREWWGAALLALSSATATGGCADHVQSGVVACPCDTGVCCSSGVCAASENACTAATAALSSESTGRWTGYAENFTFPSGSDALELTLETEPDGSLSGHLVMGSGMLPAPPSDPNVGWPASANADLPSLIEGLAYTVQNVHWTALRLRFEIAIFEPWGPWCRLQQSFAWPGGVFACISPNITTVYQGSDPRSCEIEGPDIELTPIDCQKLQLCQPSYDCACTANGCDANLETRSFEFDVALRGNEGAGSVAGLPDPNGSKFHNVRLIRASN